jgi:hypothetical protein
MRRASRIFPRALKKIARPHAVEFTGNPEAWRYRTMLRQGAAAGPDFAGHYTFVGWGCGTSCQEWALVDALTGRVSFFPDFRAVSGIHVATTDSLVRFRVSSGLLVVIGAPNEDEARDGITYFSWDGRALNQLRFISRAELCASGPPQ